jgi:MFS family permease
VVRLHLATHRIPIVTASRYFGLSDRGDRLASHGRVESRSSSSWKVLRSNPNFRRYFAGSVLSDFGTWLQNTAQVLLAYRLSHSIMVVGLVTCAQFTSPLVLGPWAGVVTARFGGRRTLLLTQITAATFAGVMAGLLFTGPINAEWLGMGAIASGVAFTFALPARNVTVRRLVAEKDVEPAFAMDSVSYNLGRAAAPPVSVLIVVTLGFGWAFAANAGSFLVFAGCLVLAGRGRPSQRPELRKRRRPELKDGFVAARGNWKIAVLLLMVAAVTMADDPVQVLGPALASHLHVAASWSGWFIAALGAGTVVGSFRPSRHNPSLPLAASALAVLAACMVVFVMSPVAWASLAAAFGAGVACLIANAATRTLLAKHAGREKEAGVMAVWAIAWAGSKPLASLTDGLLAGSVGLRWAGFLLTLPALVPFTILVWLMIFILVMRRWKPQPGSWLAGIQSRLESMEWYRRAEHHLLRSHGVGTRVGAGLHDRDGAATAGRPAPPASCLTPAAPDLGR